VAQGKTEGERYTDVMALDLSAPTDRWNASLSRLEAHIMIGSVDFDPRTLSLGDLMYARLALGMNRDRA
jgi:hypothetical protein